MTWAVHLGMGRYDPLNYDFGVWDSVYAWWLYQQERALSQHPQFKRLTFTQTPERKAAQIECALAETDIWDD